ncbi:hypothetical protein [Furfurilactobacillus rossiae]|nr:hypothetical protein [Furfurilactobacillus rossiae]QFR66416.1 hypothetical protein LR814_04615 [Furfurilactobacillus rossiae]QLE61872.1 hypothetical protein LROSRS0_1827 [Furfurilactobacillus rossiae]
MSNTDQTHKRYLQNSDGSVYWPFTAWDAIVGKPADLIDQPDLAAAIAKIPQPDLTGYLKKDALSSYQTIAAMNAYVLGTDLTNRLQNYVLTNDLPNFDAFAKNADITAALAKKADVGDSFTKAEEKATFATLASVSTIIDGRLPDIDANLAMQILMEGLKVTPNFVTGHLDYETTPTTDSTITGAMMNLYLTKINLREDEKGHMISEVIQ